jgi:hypothetical protein
LPFIESAESRKELSLDVFEQNFDLRLLESVFVDR